MTYDPIAVDSCFLFIYLISPPFQMIKIPKPDKDKKNLCL